MSLPPENTGKSPNEIAPGRVEVDDGVAWLRLDDPEKRVNTLSTRYFGWFEEQVERLSGEGLRGLVIASAKPGSFIAGADIHELGAFTEAEQVLATIRRGHALVGRFAELPFPVVAAIDGTCLGGGLELSLACDLRVATNAPHTKLGVPEVQLGLYPGLGGTQRLPRLIGVPDALDLILTGKQIDARKAKRLGLVDAVCHPHDLEQAVLRLIAAGKPGSEGYSGPEQDGPSGLGRKAGDLLARIPGARKVVFDRARETVLKKTGGHYPAPLRAIEVVKEGIGMPLAEGLELEARGFSELVLTGVAKSLIGVFFAKNGVEGRAGVLAKGADAPERIGVLGAGFMGAGIAQLLAHKGYEVVLKDRDLESLGRGLEQCGRLFGGLVKRRKYRPVERKIAMSRIVPTTADNAFSGAPFVIEAVFEDLEVKREVVRQVEAAAPDDSIFASNTSTLPIADIAAASERPERVIGMHFFSPVHKMPLLEIIRHPGTSDETLAATVAVGRRMGKTIIVVNDGPGFFTSRVLGPFVNEALWCLSEGARIDEIDKALRRWGFPVGPLALLDEVGLDVGQHAGKTLADHAGERAAPSPVFAQMIEAGRLGRKAKKGFYNYRLEPKQPAGKVYDLIGWQSGRLEGDEIAERCWLQMLNETARCIEDGIITEPDDIDIGVIFGLGFPPFRGGILREADRQGLQNVVAKLDGYAERHGIRLEPAQLLRDMAAAGETFHPAR